MSEDRPWGLDDGMAIAAVRYCLGRRTYIVGECCDWLRANWARFSERARNTIMRDVEKAIAWDDSARKLGTYSVYPLGMDMDRAEWVRVTALWRDHFVNADKMVEGAQG